VDTPELTFTLNEQNGDQMSDGQRYCLSLGSWPLLLSMLPDVYPIFPVNLTEDLRQLCAEVLLNLTELSELASILLLAQALSP